MRMMMRLVLCASLALILSDSAAGGVRERIVSLTSGHTEVVYALGLRDQLVGVTRYCNYPPEVNADKAAGRLAVVGGFVDIDPDSVAALKPTLVLTCHQVQDTLALTLKSRGFRVLHFDPASLEDVFRLIESVGDATGKSRLAHDMARRYRRELGQIRQRTSHLEKVSVYIKVGRSGRAFGAGSPVNDMIEIAGGENIFKDVAESSFIAEDTDVAWRDPEVILTPLWPGSDRAYSIYEIVTTPGYRDIRAVKNNRVYYFDSSLFKRPGPRQIIAVKKLAYLLHPYHFKNPDNSVDPWELGVIDSSGERPEDLK